MNRIQKIILSVFLPLTAMELILVGKFMSYGGVRYFAFGVTFLLFAFAAIARKNHAEQKLLVFAFLFSAVGDFFALFFVGSPLGVVGFLASYVFLVAAFNRGSRPNMFQLMILVPFIGVVANFFRTMGQYIEGVMMAAALMFSVTIVIMVWTAVTTLFRGYFTRRVATVVSLAAVTLFIGDMFVAYRLFHPAFADAPIWLEVVMRATYVPPWTMLLLVACDNNIRVASGNQG